VLTPRLHMTMDGVQNAYTGGFIAANNGHAMTSTNNMLGIYERLGGAGNVNPVMAMARGGATDSPSLIYPRSTDDTLRARLNSSGLIIDGLNADWTGLTVIQRNGNVLQVYRRGQQLGPNYDLSNFTSSALLADRPLRVGCNTPGLGGDIPTGFRVCHPALAFAGRWMDGPYHPQLDQIFTTLLANFGADV
jgi:hypothetical protein